MKIWSCGSLWQLLLVLAQLAIFTPEKRNIGGWRNANLFHFMSHMTSFFSNVVVILTFQCLQTTIFNFCMKKKKLKKVASPGIRTNDLLHRRAAPFLTELQVLITVPGIIVFIMTNVRRAKTIISIAWDVTSILMSERCQRTHNLWIPTSIRYQSAIPILCNHLLYI